MVTTGRRDIRAPLEGVRLPMGFPLDRSQMLGDQANRYQRFEAIWRAPAGWRVRGS